MKRICFIYTETTGLHNTTKEVLKKNLYNYARLVVLNYEIGIVKNNNFISEIKIRQIIKPRCMYIPDDTLKFHGITNEIANEKGIDPEIVMNEFNNNIKNVDIIITHGAQFHIDTILAESLKYNIIINIQKYVIIDTISFYHDYGYIKLKDLALKLKLSDDKEKCDLIQDVFFKLYSKYYKSLK